MPSAWTRRQAYMSIQRRFTASITTESTFTSTQSICPSHHHSERQFFTKQEHHRKALLSRGRTPNAFSLARAPSEAWCLRCTASEKQRLNEGDGRTTF